MFDLALKHYAILEKENIFDELAKSRGLGTLGLKGVGKDTTQYLLRVLELNINEAIFKNPAQSVMIGDKPRDVEAANGAGVKGILIEPDELIDYHKVKAILASEITSSFRHELFAIEKSFIFLSSVFGGGVIR